MTLETGKPRVESIAEVEEAIDLIETYCRQIEEHEGYEVPLGTLADNERNRSVLRPFGVFGVIGPFNFPVALVDGHERRRARRRQHDRAQAVRARAVVGRARRRGVRRVPNSRPAS